MPQHDITTVMNENVERLMALPDVVMVAIGETEAGVPCIQIHVGEDASEVRQEIGTTLAGHPVIYHASGEIRPLK